MIVQGANTDALCSYGVDTWMRLKQERVEKERVWTECLLAYNSKFGDNWKNVQQFRSRRFIPMTKEAVENVASNMVQGLMPHDDWFNIMGRTPDDDPGAKAMTALMKWQHYKTGFRQKTAKLIKDACIFGNVPWAMVWKQDLQATPDPEAHANQMGEWLAQVQSGQADPNQPPQTPMVMKRKYDGPELVVGNPFDYVQERHIKGGYAPRCIRFFRTKNQLLQESQLDQFGYALYENVDSLNDETPIREMTDALQRQVLTENGLVDKPIDQVELLEWWGDFEVSNIDGSKQLYKNHVLVIANRTTVIRFEPNPFAHGKCPWQLFTLAEDPIDIYSQGIVEPALDLQDVANVRWNQVIEANALTINPMLTYIEGSAFDPDNFTSAPGMLHPVSSQGDLQPINIPSQAAMGMQELGFIKSEFNQATNSESAQTTGDYNRPVSATEISIRQNSANARLTEMVRRAESVCILPILEMQLQLNQQLMDEATWIRVTEPTQPGTAIGPMGFPLPGVPAYEMPNGPIPMRITPDDIRGELDIYPAGAAWFANNQQQMPQLIQLTQAFMNNPQMAMWFLPHEFMKLAYEKAGIRDAYKFLKTPQQVAYEQQQMAMQAAQQQQGPGQGGPGQAQGQPGPRGTQSMAGAPSGPRPPASPGGQPSMGGPQQV